MNSNCVIGSIRDISNMFDKFIAQEIKKMEYPISKSSLSDIINKYVDLGFVEKP